MKAFVPAKGVAVELMDFVARSFVAAKERRTAKIKHSL